jgi:hypothetical protein
MTLPGTILDPWNNLCLDPRQPSYKQAGGDNIPNGGDGDVASIDIGGEAAAVAGERSEATGNELKPTRGGDLR